MIKAVLSSWKAISLSGLTQGISSASNFMILIVLMQSLSPREFGEYGIGFSISLLYLGVIQAIFLTQMTVNAADRAAGSREKYCSEIFYAVVLSALVTIVFCAIVAGLFLQLGNPIRRYAGMVFAFSLMAIGFSIRTFFVAYFFLFRNEVMALFVNLLSAVLLLLAVLGLFWTEAVSVEIVAIIYSLALIGGSAFGLANAKLPLMEVLMCDVVRSVVEAWRNGRWALMGIFINWTQSQAHVGVAALLLGATGVGIINAARIFVSPLLILLPAAHQVVMPRLSERRVSSPSTVVGTGKVYTVLMAGGAVTYIGSLYVFFDPVSKLLLKQQYADAASLIWVWCVVLLVFVIRSGAVTTLQALKAFRSITIDNSVSALIAVSLTIVLALWFGALGAVAGAAFGEAVFAVFLWRRIHYWRH